MLKEIGRLLVYYREQKSASVSPISVEDEEDNTAAYDGSHMRRNDCIEMNKKLACLHSHLLQKSAVRIVTPQNEERRVLLHLWIWMTTFDSVMKLSISQRRSQSRKSPTRTMRMKTIMLIWMPRPGHDPPNDIYLFFYYHFFYCFPWLFYSDLAGIEPILQDLRELIEYPLSHPEIYTHLGTSHFSFLPIALGITPPRGILLHGPPGCGKTLLAHAIAGELGVPLIKVSAPEIVSGMSGESEEKVYRYELSLIF